MNEQQFNEFIEEARDDFEAGRLYKTGTGQIVNVHGSDECKFPDRCVIHNPSDHSMSEFPTRWREDRFLMERICPHGIGHPDPDDLFFKRQMTIRMFSELPERYPDPEAAADDYMGFEGIHGCDGCCA